MIHFRKPTGFAQHPAVPTLARGAFVNSGDTTSSIEAPGASRGTAGHPSPTNLTPYGLAQQPAVPTLARGAFL